MTSVPDSCVDESVLICSRFHVKNNTKTCILRSSHLSEAIETSSHDAGHNTKYMHKAHDTNICEGVFFGGQGGGENKEEVLVHRVFVAFFLSVVVHFDKRINIVTMTQT
jgi:hypothetical protein